MLAAPRSRPWAERFSLRDRVALVTGAGGGIGRVLAWALAEAGARVAAHERTFEALEPLRRLLAASGLAATEYASDLASVEACRALADGVHAAEGGIDVLVNCAGAVVRTPIAETVASAFDHIMAVNARAPYFLSQAAHPIMRDGSGGSIVNVGSLNSHFGLATVSAYGMSKAALEQFTRVAAAEWAPDGVRVNCLIPGFMRTPLNAEALWGNDVRRAWILDRVPMARPGLPDDLVGGLLYLASDASSFVTGQTLVIDGGFLAGGSWDTQDPLAARPSAPLDPEAPPLGGPIVD
jgi:NAD(P)-dependent dehydrogenase (short-subunit alcohol dehydrogenase family)